MHLGVMYKLIGGKYQLSKLNTHYIIRMTLNFTIDSIIDIEILSLILLFGDSIFLSYYYIAFCLYK